MAKFCVECGSELKSDYVACPKCGKKLKESKKSTVVVTNNITTNNNSSNGFAIAGFVVSLVSSLLCCGTFNVLALILSIIGLIKSKELNGRGKGLAIAGIVIASIMFIIDIIIVIVYYGAIITSAVASSL